MERRGKRGEIRWGGGGRRKVKVKESSIAHIYLCLSILC